MKQQRLQQLKKVVIENSKKSPPKTLQTHILADSIETMEVYYDDRLSMLKELLNCLSIGENTKEIIFLCKEIKVVNGILNDIHTKNVLRQARA